MECVVPKRSLKIFAKVIQCLGKVGEELFFEPSADKLILRTLNQARSAFVAVTFSAGFFEAYNLSADTVVSKCKIQLKSCLAVFRSVSTVERCMLRLDEAESRLVVELQCKMGIKKTYKLTFEECESLQAVYSKENCPNKLVSRPRLLIDIVNNFHSNLDEISFVVTDKVFKVKSYLDEEKKNSANRVLQTELTVDPKDFEEYSINHIAGDITFCLKEFKALLQFCEAAGQVISIWFEQGGRPILFSVNFFNAFEVDFVLATLLDNNSSSSQSSASDAASQTPSNTSRHSKQYSSTPASTPSSSMADSILGSSQGRGSSQATPTPVGHKGEAFDDDSASPNPSSSSYVRGTLPSEGPTSVTSSMVDAISTDKRGHRRGGGADDDGDDDDDEAHAEDGEEEEEYVEGTPPSSPPFKRSRKGC